MLFRSQLLAIVTAPFVVLLAKSTNALLVPLLKLLRIKPPDGSPQALSPEELRTIVLESSNILPKKHGAILLNLFELEAITVNDIITPRSQIEFINLDAPLAQTMEQLTTAHHRRVLACDGSLDHVVGILRIRHALNLFHREELKPESLREIGRAHV